MWLDPHSLKSRFALGSGLLTLAFALGFTSWTLGVVETDLHASVLGVQRAVARSTASEINSRVALRKDAVLTIAPLLASAAPKDPPSFQAFFEPRPVLQKIFDSVAVLDATGHVVFTLPQFGTDPCLAGGLADAAWFRQALAGAPVVVSAPFRPQPAGSPCVVVASPLRNGSGPAGSAVGGLLVGVLHLSHGRLLDDVAALRIGREGYFALVDMGDPPLFVLHQRADLIATPAPRGAEHPAIAEGRQGQGGSIEGTTAYGLRMLRTFEPLRAAPWVLVAVYPLDEAFAGLNARRHEVLWVGLALGLTAALAAWSFTAWLLRPLGRLRELMESRAAEPGAPIAPRDFGSTELVALVEAYNAQAKRRQEVEARLIANDRRLQAVLDNTPARIAHVDRDQRYTFVNRHVGRGFGRLPHEMVGRTLRELRPEAMYADIEPYVRRALQGETVAFQALGLDEGVPYHYESRYVPDLDDSGQVRGFYLVAFEITELKEAQERQARVEERLRAISDNLPVLISYLDRNERYVFMNATFKHWLGIDPVAAIGQAMAAAIGDPVYAGLQPRVAACLAGERQEFEAEVDSLQGPKHLQLSYIPDLRADGHVVGMYMLGADVTELKQAQRSLARLALSDELTGLPNRAQFNDALPMAIERSARSGKAMALMFLDIDHFKPVNDQLGHGAGDAVIKEFAQRLRRGVRSTDTVARIGGDEFVVILENLHGEAEARQVAVKLLAEIGQPFEIEGRSLPLSASLGVVYHQGARLSAQTLLAHADAALYHVKASGRNGYHLMLS